MVPELSCAPLWPAFLLSRHHRGDTAAARRTVEEADRWAAKIERQLIQMEAFGCDCAVGMTAARGKIVGADQRSPAFDLAPATDMIGRREARHPTVIVIIREARQAADLAKAAGIEQQSDSLAAS